MLTTAPDAADIRARILSGETTARATIEEHISRIERTHARLNAVVLTRFEEARREADALDAARARGEALGPLHGVPFTVKESFDVRGLATTMGLSARAGVRACGDAPAVTRLRAAGGVLLGKTNVPQLLIYNEADNPVYGRTNNPWNESRATGGSSGGCAAAVAAGCVPLSVGSDIGGSVRLPAHACGVHSLKPTSGRLTLAGHAEIFVGQEAVVAQPGPIARSVRDVRLAYALLAAPPQEGNDPLFNSPPAGDPSEIEIKKLRVGFYTDNGVMRPAPAIRRAVEESARALEDAGATVLEWQPPEVVEAWDVYQSLVFGDGMAGARRQLRGSRVDGRVRWIVLGGGLPRALLRVGALEMRLARQGRTARALKNLGPHSADAYWQTVARRNRYRARFLAAWDAAGLDAVVCPVEALPAYTHGASLFLSDSLSHTALYNLLGMPAGAFAATRVREGEESDRPASLDYVERTARRVERGSAGLPVGVQVAARHWREDVVLAVMSALEEVSGEQ